MLWEELTRQKCFALQLKLFRRVKEERVHSLYLMFLDVARKIFPAGKVARNLVLRPDRSHIKTRSWKHAIAILNLFGQGYFV